MPKGLKGFQKGHPYYADGTTLFKKGHVPWSVGKVLPKKPKIHISCTICSAQFEIKPYRQKTAKYCSYVCSGLAKRETTHGVSKETRIKISNAHKGENNPFWKGGISKINDLIRHSMEYRDWRKAVFERDGYTCQDCAAVSGGGKRNDLNADHIKPFAYFPELRFDINNGKTLCVPCHRRTSTFGSRAKKYENAT